MLEKNSYCFEDSEELPEVDSAPRNFLRDARKRQMEEITKKSSGFRRPSFDALKQRASSKLDDLKEKMRRSSVSEKLESVARMGHIDRSFFGENSGDGDEEELPRRTQEGLLDSEPDRAETDFFNGDKYVGDTADGKRHGHGVYYYDSGDKYTGNWEHGKQCGHGVYVYANGDRYVGNWAGGKHHGEGTYYFKSGKIFQGTYAAGSPTGHGVFMYTNGEKLDGEWNGSAYPDYGIYTYANGDRYGGSWRQGKKHGVGTYYFGSGAKYQGEYRDGNPHGRATFIEADGRAFAEEEQPVECALHPGLRT